MRKTLVAIFVLGLAFGGCTQVKRDLAESASRPTKLDPTVSGADTDDLLIGEPVRYANLTLFPVASKAPRDADRFITLDEGLKAGTVEVLELGAESDTAEGDSPNSSVARTIGEQDYDGTQPPPSNDAEVVAAPSSPAVEATDRQEGASDGNGDTAAGDDPFAQTDLGDNPFANAESVTEVDGNVNAVKVVNRSDKSLYLMPGELILGGKQDRVIAQERIISPGQDPVEVEVFCVERGRWGGRLSLVTSQTLEALEEAGGSATPSVTVAYGGSAAAADEAQRGKFVASAGNLNTQTRRLLLEEKSQQGVWDEVAAVADEVGVNSDSGTFIAAYTSEEVAKRLQPYLTELEAPIAQHDHIVGVIVAVNGELRSVDVFESTPLFRKLWPKLLKSFAVDALTAAEADEKESGKSLTLAEVKKAFEALTNGTAEEYETKDGLVLTKQSQGSNVCFSARDTTDANEATGGAGFGGGGAVHGAGFW